MCLLVMEERGMLESEGVGAEVGKGRWKCAGAGAGAGAKDARDALVSSKMSFKKVAMVAIFIFPSSGFLLFGAFESMYVCLKMQVRL